MKVFLLLLGMQMLCQLEGKGHGSGHSHDKDAGKSSGYGSGKSSGYGSGKSSGYGSGESSGYGSGESSGYGSGKSSGDGSGKSSGDGSGKSSGSGGKTVVKPHQALCAIAMKAMANMLKVDMSKVDKIPKAELAEICEAFGTLTLEQRKQFMLCSTQLKEAIPIAAKACDKKTTAGKSSGYGSGESSGYGSGKSSGYGSGDGSKFCGGFATTCGKSWPTCKTDFPKLEKGSGNGMANTQACRLYHLSLAMKSKDDARIHCPHAAKMGGGVCVSAKGKSSGYGSGKSSGYGSGYGSGESSGYGSGYGSGKSSGYGSGYGSGKSSGYGSGSRGHEDFCKEAPSGLMKVCKALQAKCMALKAVAEQKTCMHAATKELQEKMKTLDFCAQAPSHIAQKCQYEQKKCMTISSDKEKQKACWEGKMKELMAEANRGSGSGSSMDVCAIALNAMRDMMKGVKNLKDITAAKKMDMCKSYKSMGNMMSHLAKCTSYELKAGLNNAKLLCGAKKHGSGSGAKTHIGFDGARDCGCKSGYFCNYDDGVKGGCEACSSLKKCHHAGLPQKGVADCINRCPKDKHGKLDFCEGAPSEDLAKVCKEEQKNCMTSSSDKAEQKACWEAKMKEMSKLAESLANGKKLVAKTVYVTRMVKKKRVVATQFVSKDFTNPKFKKEKENYENVFLTASGASKADSTVEYTQVAAKSGGRRLAEGSSVANWILAYNNDVQATAALVKVSSTAFSQAVAKHSGVDVKAAKADIKVFEVKVTEKTVKYEVVDAKPASGSGSGKGKPAAGSGGKAGAGGLRIRSPNACIELGSDVKIKRIGDGKLGLDANVHVNGAVDVEKLYIGGMSIEDIVRKLVAEALKKK